MVRAGVAVALAALLLGCACEPRPITPPPHAPAGGLEHTYTGKGPTVAILGDSLTVLGWDGLYRSLASDHAVKVAAWFGEGFDGGDFSDRTGVPFIDTVVDDYAVHPPAVVVLALGTNTVLGGGPHDDDVDRALDHEADAVRAFASSCKVWVTLPVDPGAAKWDTAGARRLNEFGATWADEVVDWAGAATADPGLLQADRVHPTAAGTARRTALTAQAVRACP